MEYTDDEYREFRAAEVRREMASLAIISGELRSVRTGLTTYIRIAQLRPRQVLAELMPGERNWQNRDGNWMGRASR